MHNIGRRHRTVAFVPHHSSCMLRGIPVDEQSRVHIYINLCGNYKYVCINAGFHSVENGSKFLVPSLQETPS